MKNLSISQRLFVLLAGLVAALVAAGVFDHLAQAREQEAGERRDAALQQAERIRYAMLGMGYGMRGLLVSATPEAEQKYKDDADEDFLKAVADARKIIGDRPDLLAALEAIADSTRRRRTRARRGSSSWRGATGRPRWPTTGPTTCRPARSSRSWWSGSWRSPATR